MQTEFTIINQPAANPVFVSARLLLGLLLAILLLLPSAASAQQIQIQRGPYFVGEPVVIQMGVRDTEADESDPPTCEFIGAGTPELKIKGPSVSPQFSQSTTIINGRVTSQKSAVYRFSFEITASKPGEQVVGPFEITLRGEKYETETITIPFEELADDPDMQVSLVADFSQVYVGQRIPVTVRWAFSGSNEALQTAFNKLEIRSPIFDQFDLDVAAPTTSQTLAISTGTTQIDVDATANRQELDGRDFVVIESKFHFVAREPMQATDVPISCRTEKLVRLRRSFFGSQAETTPAIATGPPISVDVLPLPTQGRPPTFAGAVGSQFTIEATANRTDVRVGDPITLSVKLSGDGYLKNLSLPALSSDSQLSSEAFQLPDGQPAGTFAGNAKQFSVTVRAKSASSKQFPGVAFSWFDPRLAKYRTTRSAAIPLSVLDAQVVSAGSVVSAARSGAGSSEGPGIRQATIGLASANLAIESDPSKLLSGGSALQLGNLWITGIYLLGVGLVAGALFARKLSQRDTTASDAKSHRRRLTGRLTSASSLETIDACNNIAGVLRETRSKLQPDLQTQCDALIAKCEQIAYAPDPDSRAAEVQSLLQGSQEIVSSIR